MSKFFQNLNGNVLCSIDTETTGLKAGYHDIIQIAVLPLTMDCVPDKTVIPFICDIKPKNPDRADPDAMRVNKRNLVDLITKGIDAYTAADFFDEWVQKLNLPFGKKIAPLACNWPFDRSFILEWLGSKTYENLIDRQYRDVQTAAIFCNDRAGWMGMDFPYPKVGLSYLCTKLNIEQTKAHDAVDDARVTAEVYRRMVTEAI